MFGVCDCAILCGAIAGARPLQAFQSRDSASSRTVAEQQAAAFADQSFKLFADPADIAADAAFVAPMAKTSAFGQRLLIDRNSQAAP